MRFISGGIIEVDRELSDLDLFALDFIRVLRKYTEYVTVSGYVSILLGRARASEDIDIIIPRMGFSRFAILLKELGKEDFYCLNAETDKAVYGYANGNLAVRFAKRNTVIPNIELKFAKNKFDETALSRRITVKLGKEDIIISNLELQIAFKEAVLKSPKDIEDARHIRNIAGCYVDKALIEGYKRLLNGFCRRK